MKGVNSRKLNLEKELREAKEDFEKKKAIFAEKSENDDRFIALLKMENEKLKRDERVVTKVVYKDGEKEGAEGVKRELGMLRKKCKEL